MIAHLFNDPSGAELFVGGAIAALILWAFRPWTEKENGKRK